MHLVLVIFRYFPHGGLQRDMRLIAEEAVRQGWTVTILTQRWQGGAIQGVNVITFPPLPLLGKLSSPMRNRRFSNQINLWLAQQKHDYVLSMNKLAITKIDGYFQGDECFAEAVACDRPWWYRFTPRGRHFLHNEQVIFSESSCKVFMLSHPARAHFVRHYGEGIQERMIELKAGLPKSRIWTNPNKSDVNPQHLKLLFVASNFWLKGLDRAIRAIAQIANKSDVHLTVIGDGKVNEFQQLAKKLKVNITFLGSRDDVIEQMRDADLLIHPARMENAGMVLLEALANALPILTTANCGYASLVADNQAGKVVSATFSQTEFDQALSTLLADFVTLRMLSNNAYQFGKTLATASIAEQIVDDIYSES